MVELEGQYVGELVLAGVELHHVRGTPDLLGLLYEVTSSIVPCVPRETELGWQTHELICLDGSRVPFIEDDVYPLPVEDDEEAAAS